MQLKIKVTVSIVLIIVVSLIGPYVGMARAQSAEQVIFPRSYTTQAGGTGGQPVSVLAVMDQSGTNDNPAAYVSFTTPKTFYLGQQMFRLPTGVSRTSVSSMSLVLNFNGPLSTTQKWSWLLYSYGTKTWVEIGSNSSISNPGSWTLLEFPTVNPTRYISPLGDIRVMLRSSNAVDDARVDFEAIRFVAGTSATPMVVPPTSTRVVTSTPRPTSTSTRVVTSTPRPTSTSLPTNTPLPTLPPTQQVGAKYYVSLLGNNSNPGTLALPWRTIQKCLDQVQPGYTCEIFGGTYNEALVLKKSGTQAARITIKNYDNQTVTVNSGSSRTLITGGRVDYYTIQGMRLISNFSAADQLDGSVDLGKNVPFSRFSKTNGNHGFVFRNCYIEGVLHFYGHNNLVENCELNGMNKFHNGIVDGYATSYNNTYRNNTIYNYTGRAVWSMESTDNILIEGNTIHDNWGGIDCDGAAIAVTRCKVINNHIYNVGKTSWAPGIFLENCFDCLIQGNVIHDIKIGVGIYAINYGNGSSTGWHTYNNVEYRNRASNTTIANNVIYNSPSNPYIYIKSVNGLIISHNTIYNTDGRPPITFTKETDDAGVVYYPINETITNNIFYAGVVTWSNTTSGLVSLGNFTGNPLFVNPPIDLHLKTVSPACKAGVNGTYAGAYPCQ